jgi:hypothetical protein
VADRGGAAPRKLFDFHGYFFSPSRDGRFLAAVPQVSGGPGGVNIVLNWTSPPGK